MVDGYLGQLFNLLETDPGLAGTTAIVLSADHGGSGTNHSTPTTLEHYTIPFYVWGDGVGRGEVGQCLVERDDLPACGQRVELLCERGD